MTMERRDAHSCSLRQALDVDGFGVVTTNPLDGLVYPGHGRVGRRDIPQHRAMGPLQHAIQNLALLCRSEGLNVVRLAIKRSIRTQASINSGVVAATEKPGSLSCRPAGLSRSASSVVSTMGSSVKLTARYGSPVTAGWTAPTAGSLMDMTK